jgi:eukaryotic-like serine/threonine-protein kinase
MAEGPVSGRMRAAVALTLGLSIAVFLLQSVVVRPHLWPAGAGITVSGDVIYGRLAEPTLMPRIRPPDLDAAREPIVITRVAPASEAAQRGIAVGTPIAGPLPPDVALQTWREAYREGPTATVALRDVRTNRSLMWQPQPVWKLDARTRDAWLRQHAPPLAQMAGFLAGAILLVALGSRGVTATLMTLALVFTAMANGGSLSGAEFGVPFVGPVIVTFGWLATALSFPIIGLAVLHFPTKAPILERSPWIPTALCVLPLPVFTASLASAAFLCGVDNAAGPLRWFGTNMWAFDASFALALAANVAIVVEGIYRYRTTLEATERRRIQIVVYTGVAAVFAYALKTGVPMVLSLAGRSFQWPWLIEALLQAIVLLPALSLPYAVAIKHVFSPRTVLRRSLQYALARKTLSFVVLLPMAALALSLFTQRDRPLAEIVLGQPLYYALGVGLIMLGLRYRDQAQRAIDKKFFRAEYDAREILVALANRVPLEQDPAQLVSLVIASIDQALHPEAVAVLAGDDARLEVLATARMAADALLRDSGLATLLRWSDEPLEIFLDDERSPAARLPAADRAWLQHSEAALLVPIFAGTGTPAGPLTGGDASARPLTGVIVLGAKRSEEPYTAEDRKLLSGIAAQMGVALDLSRLRRQAAAPRALTLTPTLTPTMIIGRDIAGPSALAMCPGCHRCYDVAQVRPVNGFAVCPDDAAVLQPVIGMPPLVDGKYRIDAVIGRGGMGAVFRARDVRLDRDVAVKVVRADLVNNPESQARFQREAQIVARLQHPAIVTVFDYGSVPDGAAFLVMELVRGEDLRHLLRRETKLSAERTIALVTGIAAGVEAAHRAGVLHRDLKPENILLPDNGVGPKVLDFGIAKITDNASTGLATQGATVVGTPAYMAPEQLRGDTLDARADVYSLGVIAYEAITARLPYGGGSFMDMAFRQAAGGTFALDDVPPRLADVLSRALALERAQRPATAAAFAEELRLLL